MRRKAPTERILFIICVCCALLQANHLRAAAAAGEASQLPTAVESSSWYWKPGFGLRGLNGPCYAAVIDGGGNLYVGGRFQYAGGVLVNNVAKWDGTSWSSLGSGMQSWETVYALALDSSGNLYVGGTFSTAGGVPASSIAKWDGRSWSALGSGISYGGATTDVRALALDAGGNLYAGGFFNRAGGVLANCIARWDGRSWSPMSTGLNARVRSLTVDAQGRVYAGGEFTTTGAGEASVNHVAEWDGTTWKTVGGGIDGQVDSLVVDVRGGLYAGGTFTHAGSISTQNLAKWDGSTWAGPGNVDGPVRVLGFDVNGELWVGGTFAKAGGSSASNIARTDGGSWRPSGVGLKAPLVGDEGVYALARHPDGAMYAGGSFATNGSDTVMNVAKWSRDKWNALDRVGNGIDGQVYALALDGAGNVYAGGDFLTAGPIAASSVAKREGTKWAALGGTDGPVYALAVDAGENLYAGGAFTSVGGIAVNHIARRTATGGWSPLGNGLDGDVTALVADAKGNLYAGGRFKKAGGVPVNSIAKWDGTNWSPLGSGLSTDLGSSVCVYALAIGADGSLYAGGSFEYAGGSKARNVAKWDGTNWSPLGGTGGPVYALALDGSGALYVGGGFITAGGVPAFNVAKKDTTGWQALGQGLKYKNCEDCGTVYALATAEGGTLYAGGRFDSSGSATIRRIARWDGSRWEALDDGIQGYPPSPVVNAVVSSGTSNVYVGGSFREAGATESSNIALWMVR
ncbi:MAG: hypothetical protein HY900_14965 [Deltaproteobacteria bacterium]|nr:hypothetical protein [Deltaproteobacteria bacterium]